MPATINLRRMSLTDLKQRHTDLLEEAAELNKTLQDPKVEMSDSEVEDTEAEIQAKLEEADEIDKVIKSKEAIAGKLNRRTGATPELPLDTKPKSVIPATARRHIVKNFRNELIGGKSPEERAYRFGQWLMAAGSVTNPGMWDNPSAKQFAREHIHVTRANQTPPDQPWLAATEGGNAAVWVPEEFSTDLIWLQLRYGMARQLLDVAPMSRETISYPKVGSDVTATFVGEAVEGTDATPTDDSQVKLTARKLMAIVIMSSELTEDAAVSIGDLMMERMARGFANKEDDCAFIGDGTSTYGNMVGINIKLGDVDGAGTNSAGLITGTGNLWSELTIGDFEQVVAVLPDFADDGEEDSPNSVWVTHRKFYFEVMAPLLRAASGAEARELMGGFRRPMFLGYPVRFCNAFPKTEANSQVVCTLGDHRRAATFGDRRAYTVSMSNEATVGSVNMWSSDQMGIKATERFDINVHSVGDSSDAGAVVGLETASS